MKFRVVCQLCGKTGVIDTEKSAAENDYWECVDLYEILDWLSLSSKKVEMWRNLELWVCEECYCNLVEVEPDYDETGEIVYVPRNPEKLFVKLLESLELKEEVQSYGLRKKKRRKRGRPIGSGKIKHPEALRRYWREQKRKYLAKKRAQGKLKFNEKEEV